MSGEGLPMESQYNIDHMIIIIITIMNNGHMLMKGGNAYTTQCDWNTI